MPLSSYCRVCGTTNATPAEMGSDHCDVCEKTRTDAMAAAKEAKPELSPDQILYVGRTAMQARAHHPHRTFINPRDFNRADMERR